MKKRVKVIAAISAVPLVGKSFIMKGKNMY